MISFIGTYRKANSSDKIWEWERGLIVKGEKGFGCAENILCRVCVVFIECCTFIKAPQILHL